MRHPTHSHTRVPDHAVLRAQLDLYGNRIGDEGAKAIGDALHVNGVLTSLNLEHNQIGVEGGKALREIAKGRPSLTLELYGN